MIGDTNPAKVFSATRPVLPHGPAVPSSPIKLTEAEIRVCKRMGLDPNNLDPGWTQQILMTRQVTQKSPTLSAYALLSESTTTEKDILSHFQRQFPDKEVRKKEVQARVGQIRTIILAMIREKRPIVEGSPRRTFKASVVAVMAINTMARGSCMRKEAVVTLITLLQRMKSNDQAKKRIVDKLSNRLNPKEMEEMQGKITLGIRR